MRIQFEEIFSDEEHHDANLKKLGRPIAIYLDGEAIGHIYPAKEGNLLQEYSLYLECDGLDFGNYQDHYFDVKFAKEAVRDLVKMAIAARDSELVEDPDQLTLF